eukprot:TRINITY_DN1441_c0_g1_i9.p1 TRINITY_DN1441_c0_g1~~TRINITY_DN1441_c0_g1_i9.p1  ORF type:complete len:113 (-),score=38.50 TRINITY_DN1441_c0_g1_i9:288-626(-)
MYEVYSFFKSVEKVLFGIYDFFLARCLVRVMKRNLEVFEKLGKEWGVSFKENIEKIRTMREVDKLVTARLNGFETTDNYYRKTSLGKRLMKIKVPSLLFSALDDPVIMYTLP